MKLYHAIPNIILAVALENRPKILLLSPYLNYFRLELNDKAFILFFLIVCLLVCVVDHGVNEGEPVDEQYREKMNDDQFRDPEPEGQYLDQDFPEGFENGNFNLIL